MGHVLSSVNLKENHLNRNAEPRFRGGEILAYDSNMEIS